MPKEVVLSRQIRVGIIAVAHSDDLLSNIGAGAWEASGAGEVEAALPADGFTVTRPLVVHRGGLPEIVKVMKDWCDAPNAEARCDLILTVGGDGVSPKDVIADATRQVIDRELPGLAGHVITFAANAIKPKDSSRVHSAILSRATAGTRKRTMIVNIPSCYDHPADAVKLLLPLLPDVLAELEVDAFTAEPAPAA